MTPRELYEAMLTKGAEAYDILALYNGECQQCATPIDPEGPFVFRAHSHGLVRPWHDDCFITFMRDEPNPRRELENAL